MAHWDAIWYGIVGGFLLYALAVFRRERFALVGTLLMLRDDVRGMSESVGEGMAIATGIHLMYCVSHPELMIELRNPNGPVQLLVGQHFHIDTLHSAHMFLGGLVAVVLGLGGLARLCTERSASYTTRGQG